MPRVRRSLPEAERERLTALRTHALDRVADLANEAPGAVDDVLGAIAWTSAVSGPDDDRLPALIEQALAHFEWAQIAVAFGLDPGDRNAVLSLSKRHTRRRHR